MTVLTNTNFMNEVELADELCVIDLYADWCGPCKMLAPIIEELEKDYKGKPVKFCKANVDKEPALADIFGVTSIPLVAFVKENTFLDLSEGFVPKESLAAMIDKYI